MTTGSVGRGEGLARAYSWGLGTEQEREKGSPSAGTRCDNSSSDEESLDEDGIFYVAWCLIVLSMLEARE